MAVDTKLYDLLGVLPDANDSQLKKAYYECAKKNHPDKGGDPEKFKEMDEAYKILKDPNSRHVYDTTGSTKPARQDGMPEGMNDAFSFMNNVFTNINFSGHQQQHGAQQERTQDVLHDIHLSLTDLYKGRTKTFNIKRVKCCGTCEGKGATITVQCQLCNGMGKVQVQQNHGIMTMMHIIQCQQCTGKGITFNAEDGCKECNASGHAQITESITINIAPGTMDGFTFVERGKADEKYKSVTGNLIFVIRQKPDPYGFKRRGNDLHVNVRVPLLTALIGGFVSIVHISGEKLNLELENRKVISHGEKRTLEGDGMPIPNSLKNGDLHIELQIDMPSAEWAENVNVGKLRRILAEQCDD